MGKWPFIPLFTMRPILNDNSFRGFTHYSITITDFTTHTNVEGIGSNMSAKFSADLCLYYYNISNAVDLNY